MLLTEPWCPMYLRIHLPVSAAHTAAVLSADPVPRQGEFTLDTSTSQMPSLLKENYF